MAKSIAFNCCVIFASVTWLLTGSAPSVAEAQGYRELAAVPFEGRGVDLFGVVSDHSVERRYQGEGEALFESFEALGGVAKDIAAIELADGLSEVFIVDRNEGLWRSRQLPDRAWSEWELLDSATKQVSVARAASGRVELFVVGSDGVLWNMGRDSDDASFGAWQRFEIEATRLSAIAADGGGFELAVIAPDRSIQYLRFNDLGELSAEAENLAGGSLDLALGALPGGGRCLMTVGTDNTLWERRLVDAEQGWSDWQSVGPSGLRVALTSSGDPLELFSLDRSGTVLRSQLTAADASWSEPVPIAPAGPLASRLEGRARLIIASLDVDKDVPVTIDLRFSTDRSQVEITAFPSVVTEPFDTPFGTTTSTVSLAGSSAGEWLSEQGILRLPVTLHFDQSLDLPIIEEDGNLSVTLSSEAEAGQLLDASSGEVTLSGSGRFDGVGSTNPIDGQSAQVIVTGRLTPTP